MAVLLKQRFDDGANGWSWLGKGPYQPFHDINRTYFQISVPPTNGPKSGGNSAARSFGVQSRGAEELG